MGVYNKRRLTFAEFIIALIQNISIKNVTSVSFSESVQSKYRKKFTMKDLY